MTPATEYLELVVGQRHFACAPLHATLDTRSCAERWQRAMKPDADRLVLCRRCPIGRRHHAEHFGGAEVPKQSVRASVCIRCGRPAARMIAREICPSCFNRFREFLKNRNGRGSVPANYRPAVARRVGVIGDDGAPAWVLFDGQSTPEAMARATRAGLRLNPAQPGRTHWNETAGRFEYRDEVGRILIELEIDGRVEYIGVDSLHPGEQPAPVTIPTLLMTAEEAAEWLAISGEGAKLGTDVRQLEFACARCRRGMLHGCKRRNQINVECSAGCC